MTIYAPLAYLFGLLPTFSLPRMLFKWSKQSYDESPTTPKLPSIALPPNSPIRRTPSSQASPISEKSSKRSSLVGRFLPDRRSETPHQGLTRRRRESIDGGHTARISTVSMSRGLDDDLFKPAKTMEVVPMKTAPPVHTSKAVTRLEKTERSAVPLKSAMKGGSFYSPTGKQDSPPAPAHRHSNRQALVPSDHSGNEFHRTRHQSITGHSPPLRTTGAHTPKYMKAYIKPVPLKEEAVALSWPLTDYASRRHSRTPPLYFDIGFDPRIDEFAVRANRGGYSSPLSRDESDTPVSPHAFMPEMTIICPGFECWPIIVRRSRGLRCIDVFRAIYDTFAEPLTRNDQSSVGEAYIKRCERAFLQRCSDAPGLSLYNQRCGMRRVDLLRGRRVFKGLVPDPDVGSRWILHFEDLPT